VTEIPAAPVGNSQPSQPNNLGSQEGSREAVTIAPSAPSSKLKTALKVLLILVSWILFSYIFYGTLFGDASTPGGKLILGPNPKSEAGWSLLIGFIIFPPIIALLGSVATIVFCLKSSKRLLMFIASIVLVTALVIVYSVTSSSIAVNSVPKKVSFEVYKPSANNPFKDLHQSYFPVDESVKEECRGAKYSFYGANDPMVNPPFTLNETLANSYNCPEFEYFSRELYDQAEKAAEAGGIYDVDKTVSKKLVGSEPVLVIRDKEGSTLYSIVSIKNNTLINISTINSNCPGGSPCEQKYLDFYKSLQI